MTVVTTRRLRQLRCAAGRLLLCYLAGACATWRTVPSGTAPHPTSSREYSWARVTLRDRTVIALRRARVYEDSVTGNVPKGRTWQRIGVDLVDVTRIESRQVDPGLTLLVAVTVIFVVIPTAIGVIYAVGCSVVDGGCT